MHVSRLLFLLFTLVPSSLSSKQQEDFLLLVKYEDGTREFARRVLRILPQTVENLRRLARLDIHLRTVDCEDTKPAIECHRLDLLSSAVVLFPDTPSTGPTLDGHVYETDLSDAEIEKAFLEIASERFHEDLLMFHSSGSEGAASKGERPESTVVLFPLLDLDPSIELEGEEVLKEFIAKSTRKDVSFVLYWLSVDIPSRNLALALSNISKAHPELRIGTVACHEHPLSCDSRGVTEFPLLRAYRKGALYKVFHGLPSQTALSEWMRMLNQPEIYQVKQETMASFREGYVPGFPGEVRRAVTVGFFTSKDTKEYKDFERVATLLHGRYHLSALVDKEISKWAHNPALATFRPFEPVSKADALHKDMSGEAMKDFVVASSSPSVLNVTSPLLFSEISRRGLPLVVLLHEDSSTLLHEVAVDIDRRHQVTFASLNNTMSEFGQKLLRKWKIRRSLLPVVILLDTEKGALFLHDVHKDSTKDDVWNWVTKTLMKPGEPHVLLPRYEESMASTLGQEDQLLRTEGRASEPAAKLVLPEGSLPVPGVASHFLKEEL